MNEAPAVAERAVSLIPDCYIKSVVKVTSLPFLGSEPPLTAVIPESLNRLSVLTRLKRPPADSMIRALALRLPDFLEAFVEPRCVRKSYANPQAPSRMAFQTLISRAAKSLTPTPK